MPGISTLFAAFRLSSAVPAASTVTADTASPSPKATPRTFDGLMPRHASAAADGLPPRKPAPTREPLLPKCIPYYSGKQDRANQVNLNGRVPYPGAEEHGEVIECRHLALSWAMQLDATGQPDYAAFSSEDAIKKNVKPDVGALYFRLLTSAPEAKLVPLGDWGRFIAGELKSLEATGAPAAKRLLVNSGNHAMALELKVKQGAGGSRYVAKFYDPNLTATHKRVASDHIARFETLQVADLLNKPSLAKAYFGDESVALVMTLPPGGPASLPPPGSVPERRLAGPVPPLDESVMDPLLSFGFAGTLRDLQARVTELASQDPDKAERVLAARAGDGIPGLSMALADSHTQTVSAFVDLVAASGLPKPVQMRLLAAPSSNGSPGLAEGLGTGKPETVQAYLDSLDRHPLLDDDDKARLLATRGPDGRTALVHALSTGDPDTLAALAGRIARLEIDPKARCALLLAIDNDGSPGLAEPAQADDVDRVAAFVEAVLDSPMSTQEKVYVLRAGVPPGDLLAAAQEQGASQAISVYRAAIRQSQLPLRDKALLLCEPPAAQPWPQAQRALQTAH